MNLENFPLLTLAPVVDGHGRWVALLFSAATPLTGPDFARLMAETELRETAEILPCLFDIEAETFDLTPASLPRERLIFLVSPDFACDPAQRARLEALIASGAALMLKGMPLPGCVLPSAIRRLAVPCPGHAIPRELGHWLAHLPGPHLALGTSENLCPGRCLFQWLSGHLPGHRPPRSEHDPALRSLLLRLLALVVADADNDEIEALIKRDAHLTYQLLRLVNSAAFAPGRRIDTLAQAIALLGRRQLQRWLQLLLYVRPHHAGGPNPLLAQAAFRAALLESITKRLGGDADEEDRAFLVGMFSLLDQLFGMPLSEILAPLPLSEEVTRALLAGEGRLGERLSCIVFNDNGDFSKLGELLSRIDLAPIAWSAALLAAARWASQVAGED